MNKTCLAIVLWISATAPCLAQAARDESPHPRCSDWKNVGDHTWVRTSDLSEGNVTLKAQKRTIRDTAETKMLDAMCGH